MKKQLLTLGTISTITVPSVLAISCADDKLPVLKSQSFGYVLNNVDEVASLILHNSNSGRSGAAFLDINKLEGGEPTNGRIYTKTYILKEGVADSIPLKGYLLEELANDNADIAKKLHDRHMKNHPSISWEDYLGGLKYSIIIDQENQCFTFSIFEYEYLYAPEPTPVIINPIQPVGQQAPTNPTPVEPEPPVIVEPPVVKNELEEFADFFVSTMAKNPNTLMAEGYQYFKGVAIFDYDKFATRYHMDANYDKDDTISNEVEFKRAVAVNGVEPVEKHANNLMRTKYLAFGEHGDITIIFHPVLDIENERFSVKLEFNKGGTVQIGSDDSIRNHDANFPTVYKTVFIPGAFPTSTTQMDFSANEAVYRNALTKTQEWVFSNKGSLTTFAGQEPMLTPYITVVQGSADHFTREVASDPDFIEQSFNDSCASSKIDMEAFLLNANTTRGQGLNFSMTSAGPNSLLAILESVLFVYENKDLIDETYARLHP